MTIWTILGAMALAYPFWDAWTRINKRVKDLEEFSRGTAVLLAALATHTHDIDLREDAHAADHH